MTRDKLEKLERIKFKVGLPLSDYYITVVEE